MTGLGSKGPQLMKPNDVDLTGGFRLDLRTLALILALAASWWDQKNNINAISQRIDLSEKARVAIEEAKNNLAQEQQRQFEQTLSKLEAQLKLTAIDVAELRVQTASRKQ